MGAVLPALAQVSVLTQHNDNNTTEGADSTGIFTNGVSPTTPATDLTGKVDLHSGHTFNVAMVYDGTTLSVTITDATTNATATQTYTIDIPGTVGGSAAYVGFTGGTGGLTATQDILKTVCVISVYAILPYSADFSVTELSRKLTD